MQRSALFNCNRFPISSKKCPRTTISSNLRINFATWIKHLLADDYHNYIDNDGQNFVSDEFLLLCNAIKVNEVGEMETGKPYRVAEGRVLLITSGKAVYQMNMTDYTLLPSTAFVVPAGFIVVIKSVSSDFNIQAMSIKDLDETTLFPEVTRITLDYNDFHRIMGFIDLLWEVAHSQSFSLPEIHYLQKAMLEDLRHIHDINGHDPTSQPSHTQKVFSDFVGLVNKYGAREHHVAFYADKLFITPNRLSNLVKQQSGDTVMQWINRAIILEAKVMLRHSDMKNYEIAEHLNFPNASFFNKFFKKQTGQTPLEYSKS